MGLHSYIRKAQIKYYGRFGTVQVPEKWAFLVGSTNSGSTLLKEVLASHPRIASMHRGGQHYTDVFFKPGQFARLVAVAGGCAMALSADVSAWLFCFTLSGERRYASSIMRSTSMKPGRP